MTVIRLKLLVNRFDHDPSIKESEFVHGASVASVKSQLFSSDVEQQHNIRVIHRGSLLRDDALLERLQGYVVGEPLVLTVFITKPDSAHSPRGRAPRNDLWKWSTSAWIMVVATLWCYKFKLADSFRRFPVLVLYVSTFLCMQMIFSRVVSSGRVDSR